MKIPKIGLIISIIFFVSFILFVSVHFGEAERFAELAKQIKPKWFILAAVLQLTTYICVGMIWKMITSAYGYTLKVPTLSKLAIEKLSIDQLVPTIGVSGNLVVGRAIKRLGLSVHQTTEALVLEVLSRASSYTIVGIISFIALIILDKFSLFLFIPLIAVILTISLTPFLAWWLLRHRNWQVPRFFLRFNAVRQIFDVVIKISGEKIFSSKIFAEAVLLQIAIFVLDGATLLVALKAIGVHSSFIVSFTALVVASIAGLITFLPGGIGGFEAACTAILIMFGVSVEAALTSTLLLRVMTLWLPIIPGFILVNRDEYLAKSK